MNQLINSLITPLLLAVDITLPPVPILPGLPIPEVSISTSWFQVFSTGINVGLLVVGVKMIRQFSRIELKVDTMWGVFMKRYGHVVSGEQD